MKIIPLFVMKCRLINLLAFLLICQLVNAQKAKFKTIVSPYKYSISIPVSFHKEVPTSKSTEWEFDNGLATIIATIQDADNKVDDGAIDVLLARSNESIINDKRAKGLSNVHIAQRVITDLNHKKTYSEIITYTLAGIEFGSVSN